jgi:hypothetical protein
VTPDEIRNVTLYGLCQAHRVPLEVRMVPVRGYPGEWMASLFCQACNDGVPPQVSP